MKLLDYDADLTNIDCHLHSRFSPDALRAGAAAPRDIADAVRARRLRGFIITDHVDVGRWHCVDPSRFAEYIDTWNAVRDENPDLTIYIGMEVGFEKSTAEETAELISRLPLEYVINSVHYWQSSDDDWAHGREYAYCKYLEAVLASLDAPYPFTTIGHLGFPERYAPYPVGEQAMEYKPFKPIMDEIIKKAIAKRVRFEENTNGGAEFRLPRADFLRAYKKAGGARPVLGSDAHVSGSIAQNFPAAEKFLDKIF